MKERRRKQPNDPLTQLQRETTRLIERVPWWIWGICLLIFAAFVFQLVFSGLGTFGYKGLTFTQERYGDIDMYRYSYFIDAKTQYNLYVRGDPRENTVPVEGNISFDSKKVYISVNASDLRACEDSSLGIGQLSLFLAQNKLKVKSATPDGTDAFQYNVTQAICGSFPGDTTIMIQSGTQSSIIKEGSCYTLTVADCQVLPVVEKFMVESVIYAREQKDT